jgi:hypothetical protein
MNLYFQFLTQNQSASAIELIQLPALLVSGQAIAGKTKMSTGGKLMHSKFSSIETLSAKLAKTRFNELEVIYDIKKLKIGMTTAQVENLNGVFYPSTTGELWFSWKNFEPLEDRRGHQRKMMAKGDEEAVACHRVSLMPCVFEVALEIETSKSQKQVLDNCAEWLANSIGKMFGAKQVYSELAVALGKDAKLICGTGASDFAVIRLNTKCDITAAKERAKNWLLPTIR